MKNSLLYLLLACGSLHAMDINVHIVPFDSTKHYDAINLLTSVTSKPTEGQETIKVLVQTRSHRPDKVLGAIAYLTSDFEVETWTTITALAIASQYQRKGYGRLLMQYVEESITTDKQHSLYLFPISASVESFCKKLGYEYGSTVGFMGKIVNKI